MRNKMLAAELIKTVSDKIKTVSNMYQKNIIYQVFLNFDLETPAYLHTQKHFLVCYNFGKQSLIAVD